MGNGNRNSSDFEVLNSSNSEQFRGLASNLQANYILIAHIIRRPFAAAENIKENCPQADVYFFLFLLFVGRRFSAAKRSTLEIRPESTQAVLHVQTCAFSIRLNQL